MQTASTLMSFMKQVQVDDEIAERKIIPLNRFDCFSLSLRRFEEERRRKIGLRWRPRKTLTFHLFSVSVHRAHHLLQGETKCKQCARNNSKMGPATAAMAVTFAVFTAGTCCAALLRSWRARCSRLRKWFAYCTFRLSGCTMPTQITVPPISVRAYLAFNWCQPRLELAFTFFRIRKQRPIEWWRARERAAQTERREKWLWISVQWGQWVRKVKKKRRNGENEAETKIEERKNPLRLADACVAMQRNWNVGQVAVSRDFPLSLIWFIGDLVSSASASVRAMRLHTAQIGKKSTRFGSSLTAVWAPRDS